MFSGQDAGHIRAVTILSKRMWMIGGGLVLAALLLGWIFGGVAWFLVLGLSVFIGLLLREVDAFLRWSERPLRRPENQDLVWDQATSSIYQQLYRERARARAILQRLRNLQVMTESLPDGAVVVSENGSIEQMNSAAKSLLGLQDRDKGQNLAALVRHPQMPALLKNQYQDNIVEFSSPLNRAQQLEIRKFQAEDQRLILLIRDVTERNRLLSMRQEFIANVSHELRSPLTVIIGYLEALGDADIDLPNMRELVQRLNSPAHRMQSLVEDLLLLTRLESAPVPVERDQQQIEIGQLVGQVVKEVSPLAGPTHEIRVELESAALVCGTEAELFSAFSNLLANAIRYSPEGGVITVRWDDCAAGAEFSVVDQGVGIPEEHLTRLTERFYRVDLGGSRVRGGTGLGLAIVKHVLKRHRSQLAVTSALGQGSRFACVFPDDQLIRNPSVSLEAQ